MGLGCESFPLSGRPEWVLRISQPGTCPKPCSHIPTAVLCTPIVCSGCPPVPNIPWPDSVAETTATTHYTQTQNHAQTQRSRGAGWVPVSRDRTKETYPHISNRFLEDTVPPAAALGDSVHSARSDHLPLQTDTWGLTVRTHHSDKRRGGMPAPTQEGHQVQ